MLMPIREKEPLQGKAEIQLVSDVKYTCGNVLRVLICSRSLDWTDMYYTCTLSTKILKS